MSLKLSATYRIQTQMTSLILNLASKKVRGRGLSPNLNPRGLHDRRFLSEWSSRPARTSWITPRAGSPTGAISRRPRRSVRSMLGISPSAWEAAQVAMGEIPAAIVVAAHPAKGGRDQQRRRISARADAKSRGGRIHDRADADGADCGAQSREEASVSRISLAPARGSLGGCGRSRRCIRLRVETSHHQAERGVARAR